MCSTIQRNSIKVIDGGFSSQLSKYDNNFHNHPLWCSYLIYTNPKIVYQTHLDFLRVGADIIETNTYQASIEGYKKHIEQNLSDSQCIALIEKAVKLALDAKNTYLAERKTNQLPTKEIIIAGSVGPYGAFLHDASEYTASYIKNTSIDDIRTWHIPRIEALLRAGVDILAFETLPVSEEAEMLATLLKEYPNAKAWISFSCKDGLHLNSGENFQEVAKKCYGINPEQIIGIGVNCSNPEFIESLFKDFNADRKDNPISLIVYPNSGEIYDKEKGWTEFEKCKPLESYVKTWIDLGVKYIGGCCRIFDENIRKIRETIDEYVN